MQIQYDSKTDLLYLRLDDERQHVVNRRVSDDVVLDIGRDDRLVGIEIMDASRHVRMDKLLPVTYEASPVDKVPAMVREHGTRQVANSEKAQRTKEDIDMTISDFVEIDPRRCGGKPVVAGTRIPVTVVIDQLADAGSIESLLRKSPELTAQKIAGVLRYCHSLIERTELEPAPA